MQPKIPIILKWEQLVRKFRWKVSKKSGRFLIFEKRTEFATNTEFQKFRETNKMERKFLLGNVRNLSKARDVVLYLR